MSLMFNLIHAIDLSGAASGSDRHVVPVAGCPRRATVAAEVLVDVETN